MLVPLIRGSVASSRRPPGVPVLMTGAIANSAIFFDDLFQADFAASGNPSWLVQNVAGTGTVSPLSTAGAPGNLTVATGASANDCTLLQQNVRAASAGAGGQFWGSGYDWILQLRVGSGSNATTSCRQGAAVFTNSLIALGTNWLNDPATVLASASYMALVRDTGVTPSGGSAGDWALYVGEGTGADAQVLLLGSAAAQSFYKLEAAWSESAKALTVYWNGALAGTLAMPNTTFAAGRLEFGAQTLTTVLRQCVLDSIYYETAINSVR